MAEKPMLGGCCVCLDERGWAENPLVYCDGQSCNVAVHQACYGIVKVPSGPWFCRKCESQERAAKVKCELCPHRDGALKRTDNAGWAHVVCALYIPEVTFGSVSSMEPIILQKVPPDRYNKTCYLCEEESRSSKASSGACMNCAKQGCKSSFHVTCAQMSGLLCEEASGGNQTKYCGYCKTHLTKGKKMSSSYKSLSCAKVYKLPTTSSSDELGSPERSIPILPEANTMKPGDIRYTKAGKKRSKSLEESLAADSTEHKVSSPAHEAQETISEENSTSIPKAPQTPPQASSNQPLSLANLQSSPVPVVSVEQLSIKSAIQSTNDSQSKSDTIPGEKDKQEKMDTTESNEHSNAVNSSNAESGNVQQDILPTNVIKPSSSGLTLSSLAEAASAISQSSANEAVEENNQNSTKADVPKQKKVKTTSKDGAAKKKPKEKKPRAKKTTDSAQKKGESSSKSKKKAKISNSVIAHMPIPPSLTTKDPATVAGTAIYPRHSVVTLANIGGRSETYGPHEIGENNKIFKPDFSVDGVTALERFQEEQKADSLEFFREYGTTPDVAALMEALHKVREDNKNMQLAIEQMARRRDQLLLIKTRLMGLQTNNNISTTITTTSNNQPQRNTPMSRPAHTPALPSHTVASSHTTVQSQLTTPTAAQPTHQLPYAVSHSLNYSQMPPYPYPPVHTTK